MILTINLESERPLFRQIADAVRRGLSQGTLQPGDALPSGRELAESLGVNLETVQRAYRHLANEGIVTSRVGRGTRIAEGLDPSQFQMDRLVDELVSRGKALGMSLRELTEVIELRYSR
ncbi:MAG: GntR family transcriptional regulator [Verrucomicrobiota bacterium]